MEKHSRLILLVLFVQLIGAPVYAGKSAGAPPLPAVTPMPLTAPTVVGAPAPTSSTLPEPISVTGSTPAAPGATAPPSFASPSPTLRESVVKGNAADTQNGSVESFFQIDSARRNNEQNLLMEPAEVASSAHKNGSFTYGMYRCVWHILDNAGVPMFFGQDSHSFIDPEISGTYVIVPPKLPREKNTAKELDKSMTITSQTPPVPAANTPQSAPQKIPESELEGVPLPAPLDDANAPAP